MYCDNDQCRGGIGGHYHLGIIRRQRQNPINPPSKRDGMKIRESCVLIIEFRPQITPAFSGKTTKPIHFEQHLTTSIRDAALLLTLNAEVADTGFREA